MAPYIIPYCIKPYYIQWSVQILLNKGAKCAPAFEGMSVHIMLSIYLKYTTDQF